jgi:hypothetical protein
MWCYFSDTKGGISAPHMVRLALINAARDIGL